MEFQQSFDDARKPSIRATSQLVCCVCTLLTCHVAGNAATAMCLQRCLKVSGAVLRAVYQDKVSLWSNKDETRIGSTYCEFEKRKVRTLLQVVD